LFVSSLSSSLRPLPSFPTRRSSDLPAPARATLVRVVLLPDADPGAGGRLLLEGARGRARASALSSRPRGAPLRAAPAAQEELRGDRKSTRLNSSHVKISYAVFCLKK